jgi:hypothetical protein
VTGQVWQPPWLAIVVAPPLLCCDSNFSMYKFGAACLICSVSILLVAYVKYLEVHTSDRDIKVAWLSISVVD